MVLMLPPRQQQPTTAQRFIDAFGSGLDAVSNHMKEKQKKEKMQAAATKLQIDPAILDLPEDAQKAYFQQKFAAGPKPLNALQEAQRDAAIAKQKYYEENQKLFGNLMGGQPQQSPQGFQNQVMQEPQVDQETFGKGIMKPGEALPEKPQSKGKANSQPQFDVADPKTWPDAMISKLRAFKGQPGQQGIFGNLANDEAERREKESKTEREKTEKNEVVTEKRRATALKETLPIRKEYADKAKYARNILDNKKAALHLLKHGKVDDPGKVYLASFLPEGIANKILSTDTQLYKSGLFEDFGAIRQMFTGATRVKELDLLEDKLATLDKSPEAKQKIIAAGMNRAERDIILAKAAQQVEKEFPEATTLTFEEKVLEKAQPKLDKLFDKLLDDYQEIYFEHAPAKSTFVDQYGDRYNNVPKSQLKELFKEAKEQGIELKAL